MYPASEVWEARRLPVADARDMRSDVGVVPARLLIEEGGGKRRV
jgi:hypothetical protein